MKRLEIKESVSLIASGYEWDCPLCDHDNRIGWIPVTATSIGEVECENCGESFEIGNYDHAFGN